MLIIGCDYHPSVQQIAFVDSETGEYEEQRLNHSDGEAEKFYRELKGRGCSVRVGIEATGHSLWFERLLAELNFELCIGDPLQIKAMRVPKTEDRSPGCATVVEVVAGGAFSPGVGTGCAESRSAATALASASSGADADTNHESVASSCSERRGTTQEGTVEQVGASAVGVVLSGPLGHATPTRFTGVGGPIEPYDR